MRLLLLVLLRMLVQEGISRFPPQGLVLLGASLRPWRAAPLGADMARCDVYIHIYFKAFEMGIGRSRTGARSGKFKNALKSKRVL